MSVQRYGGKGKSEIVALVATSVGLARCVPNLSDGCLRRFRR